MWKNITSKIHSIFLCYLLPHVCLFMFLFFLVSTVYAARKGSEAWYQKVWCEGKGGQLEYVLSNSSRADCLTPEYAIEMDFARKWHESVGQSLSYARKTKKKAGIVLILKSEKDSAFVIEMEKTIQYFNLPITTWQIGPWKK